MVLNRYIVLIGVFLFIWNDAITQDTGFYSNKTRCGSHFKKGMSLAAAMKMVTPPNECTYVEKARKEFQVICHIAKDSVSEDFATNQAEIQAAFDGLNILFKPTEMSFSICEIDSMPNSRYYDWVSTEDEFHALTYRYLPNVINIYFCNSVVTNEGQVGGYALFPGGEDILVIRCVNEEISIVNLAHEMGHFFGLYHTFETSNGVELADGSNCSETGDLICDTEADSTVGFAVNCNYLFPSQDAEGNWYTPPLDNIMSYYSNECRCEFTLQQYNRMVEMYQTIRNYLW